MSRKRSMLDDDFYKFTMCQGLLAIAPEVESVHRFINRGTHRFNDAFFEAFEEGLHAMSGMKATTEELTWLRKNPVMKPWFVDYIANYRYDPDEVWYDLSDDGEFSIKIEGRLRRTILWEVKLMSMISELYFLHCDIDWSLDGQTQKAIDKSAVLDSTGCPYVDFGTRRRRDYATQDLVVRTMKDVGEHFVGTSNMHFARKYGVKCIGTTAHEWDQVFSILGGLRNAPRFAMEAWVEVYGGDLGIALADTYGSDAFFRCFEMKYAKLYDGLRHDSGSPYEFTDKAIARYDTHKIDSTSKTIVFSDGLQVPLPGRPITPDRNPTMIADHTRGKIKTAFGIGTDLTNDFTNKAGNAKSPALNMVIKLVEVNGEHVVKLSDDVGKSVGDPDAVRVANYVHRGLPLGQG